MVRKRIQVEEGLAALQAALEGAGQASRETMATAVRWSLQLLEDRAPGRTVEVRIPPFGAVQVVEGPRHTRGTPPNVIEMSASTWIDLVVGRLDWAETLAAGQISASGLRADLTPFLPLHRA